MTDYELWAEESRTLEPFKSTEPVVNGLYHFRGIEGIRMGTRFWVFPPATYRFLAIALDYRTRQKKCVYIGVGEPDDGKYFLAPLADWHRDFTLIAE